MIVVLLTGLAVAAYVGTSFAGDAVYLSLLVVLLATAAVAAAVWRFATEHEAEIGEAKFDTGSHRRDPQTEGN